MKFEAWFRTSRAPAAVFSYLANWENEARWNSWARWVRRVSDTPAAEGTVFRASFKNFGEMDEVFTDFDPPRRLTVYSDTSRAEGSFTFELEAEDSGTQGHMVIEMRPKGIMRFIAPVMLPVMMRRHIRDMAAAIERELQSPTRN